MKPEWLWSPNNPGLDCLVRKHIMVENSEEGAFPTLNGEIPTARWCLWCGTGLSNEAPPEGFTYD